MLGSNIKDLPNITLSSVFRSTRAIQLYSILMSIMSMAYSFTTYYRRKKLDAMDTVSMGTVAMFTYTLCMIISRLLAFVMFAYYFKPSEWYLPAMTVLVHVLIMSVLHYMTFTFKKFNFDVIYACALNGLANLFIHNEIKVVERVKKTKNDIDDLERNPPKIESKHGILGFLENKRHMKRTTLFIQMRTDVIFVLEILIMIAFGFSSELYKTDLTFASAMDNLAVISGVLAALGLITKAMFYGGCHLYSDLICQCPVRNKDDYDNSDNEEEKGIEMGLLRSHES